MASRDAILAVKARLSIVDLVGRYVDLKHQSGSRWVAPCPFHQETKPSFSVNAEQGTFYCFGCHASGDIFEFHGRINGLDFRETLEQLAAEAGVTLDRGPVSEADSRRAREERSERRDMLRMHDLAAAHFAAALDSPDGEECRAYMERRGISPEIIRRFELGWARRDWQSLTAALRRAGFNAESAARAGLLGRSEQGGRAYDRFRGRLMFPIRNLSNQIIAFGGRIIADEDEAKYVNSADSPIYKKGDNLYGLAQARRAIAARGHALLTEGYMDVLTLHQFGHDNAVGVLGTALTPEQIKRLSGFCSRVILLFDGDGAGRKAALRSSEMLLARGLQCRVVLMPDGEDIDSLLKSRGDAAFAELVEAAPDGLRFCADVLRAGAPREAVEWARAFLGQVEAPELVASYASALAARLQLDERVLRDSAAARRSSGRSSGGRGPAGPAAAAPGERRIQNMRERQILMFALRYPQRLDDLRDLGADLLLRSEIARRLWDKLSAWGEDELPWHLDDRERGFWNFCRGEEAAPRDDGEGELEALRGDLDAWNASVNRRSISAALRENAGAGDAEADLRFLRALQETLEKTE